MRIRTRLAAGFSLVVFSILLTAAVSLRIYERIHAQSVELREDIQPQVGAIMGLYETVVDLDRFVVAYVLYNGEEDKAQAQALAERLTTIAAGHREREHRFGPAEEAMAQAAVHAVSQYTALVEKIVAQREQGLDVVAIFQRNKGAYFLSLNDMLQQLRECGNALLAEVKIIEDALEGQRARGAVVIVTAAVVITLLAGGVGYMTTRAVVEPVRRLHAGVEAIARGDLDHRTAFGTHDELGRLSEAFDAMAAHLKTTTTSVDELNKEVARRVETEQDLQEAKQQA